LGTFNNAAQGSVSHRGLMQVGPVAAQLGGLGNGQGEGLSDARLQSVNPDYINNIWEPAANIRAGTGYMQYLMDHYGTNVEGVLERFRGSPGSQQPLKATRAIFSTVLQG
jgi:soluble lytic murein transglycosylase-like protein